jgi:hypothetical protein
MKEKKRYGKNKERKIRKKDKKPLDFYFQT